MESNRIALVTGASKGIGAAIALTLAKDGYAIWLNYRSDHESAQKVAHEIEQQGVSCQLLPFDVADPDAVQEALAPVLKEEVPHVLVNNAGFARDNLMFWMKLKEWKEVISVTLDGFFLVTKLVVSEMLRKRAGRIINIVSTSGQTGVAGQTNYSAAKAGLIGATRSLALEVARKNIIVNAVSPGFIETEMTEALPLDDIKKTIPLRRLGTPQDVAEVVRFLCSDGASYITGQVISVNGGLHT